MGTEDDQHVIKKNTRQSVLWRDSNYRTNTTTGFTTGLWQAHHILCNHSVTPDNYLDGMADDDIPFAEACIWITKWNLNDGHNMLGLPTNWQHRVNGGTDPADLPSHQVDHNTTGGYTQECTSYLKEHVWDALKDKSKDHQTNAATIETNLRNASNHFRNQLENVRGKRPDGNGTAYSWAHRFSHPPAMATAQEQADYKQEEKWYAAFSMADDENVNERAPGVDWGTAVAMIKDALKKIG